jgi:hypothetical protein
MLAVAMRRGNGRGALHVYLEYVGRSGRVTDLTEGQLGLEHRAIVR